MDTAAALVQDLPELHDVMFALEARREALAAQPSQPVPLLSVEQKRHLRADSRARAWIPAHLLESLR